MKQAVKSLLRRLGYEIGYVPSPDRHVSFDDTPAPDYELLKTFATRAAQFYGSAEQRKALRAIHLTGLLREQPYALSNRVEIGDAKTTQIGIWRRPDPDKDATFVRAPDRRAEWFYWANTDRIEPKRCKWRVVLLGESVARGYFYDPHFNPASVLHAMLEAQLGAGNVDVVDLAKSNQTIEELRIAIGQSLALSPDVLVIFAGNNWRAHVTEPDIPSAESAVRTGGVPGLKNFLDVRREEAARKLIVDANELLRAHTTKVVWVVPEFNLDDWADPPSNAPYLTGEGNRRWRELDRQAREAVRVGDAALARKTATQMTNLDGGTSSVPLRMLADQCRATGDLAGARRYLELCRDAEGWDPSFSYSPRVSSLIQNVLRDAASFPDNAVVDLPEILQRHCQTGLPDRRLFLDYCHLTAEGMKVAVAAAASQVVSFLTGETVQPQALQAKFPRPSDKVEGKACFLAAIHNAHFYQRAEVIGHWCNRAIEFWPECTELMTRVIDYETRGLPMTACKSGLELSGSDELDTMRYLSRSGQRRFDLTLCDAVVASVGRAGIDIGQNVSDLRRQVHAIDDRPKELTDFYYSSAIPGLAERGWTSRSFPTNRGSHSMFSAALWDTSNFVFFARSGQKVRLKFAYRVPMASRPGSTVAIDVNGQPVAELPAASSWLTHEIIVPEHCVADGMNEIRITWPGEDGSSEAGLRQVADHLVAGRLPWFFRVFGEIHTLSVSDPSASPGH